MCKIINFNKVLERKIERELDELEYEEYKNQPAFLGLDEYIIEYMWNLKKEK
ncbi:hypothetical protein P5E48_05800 [Clostridium perfringens]|nr:hypothetical protein [Clostridium perfringens]MDM0817416.1 hypothetical protein [Clostridium perfringens]